jgi:hypothetical protein
MKRRNKFIQVGWGVNCELWIFQSIFSRPDVAKKALKTLTGRTIESDDKAEIFYSKTYSSDIKHLAS